MGRLFRARWVLPMTGPPLRNGWVACDHGVVVGAGETPADTAGFEVIDAGEAAILPGLVNAHTHLELSWMRSQVPPDASMPAWAARLMALRRSVSAEPPEPIVEAVHELRAAGFSTAISAEPYSASCWDSAARSRSAPSRTPLRNWMR